MTMTDPYDDYPEYFMGERPDVEWYLGFKPLSDKLESELLEDNDANWQDRKK